MKLRYVQWGIEDSRFILYEFYDDQTPPKVIISKPVFADNGQLRLFEYYNGIFKQIGSDLYESIPIIAKADTSPTINFEWVNDKVSKIIKAFKSIHRPYLPDFKVIKIKQIEKGITEASILIESGVNVGDYSELSKFEFDERRFVRKIKTEAVLIRNDNERLSYFYALRNPDVVYDVIKRWPPTDKSLIIDGTNFYRSFLWITYHLVDAGMEENNITLKKHIPYIIQYATNRTFPMKYYNSHHLKWAYLLDLCSKDQIKSLAEYSYNRNLREQAIKYLGNKYDVSVFSYVKDIFLRYSGDFWVESGQNINYVDDFFALLDLLPSNEKENLITIAIEHYRNKNDIYPLCFLTYYFEIRKENEYLKSIDSFLLAENLEFQSYFTKSYSVILSESYWKYRIDSHLSLFLLPQDKAEK